MASGHISSLWDIRDFTASEAIEHLAIFQSSLPIRFSPLREFIASLLLFSGLSSYKACYGSHWLCPLDLFPTRSGGQMHRIHCAELFYTHKMHPKMHCNLELIMIGCQISHNSTLPITPAMEDLLPVWLSTFMAMAATFAESYLHFKISPGLFIINNRNNFIIFASE